VTFSILFKENVTTQVFFFEGTIIGTRLPSLDKEGSSNPPASKVLSRYKKIRNCSGSQESEFRSQDESASGEI
jgi:hypothetical protein